MGSAIFMFFAFLLLLASIPAFRITSTSGNLGMITAAFPHGQFHTKMLSHAGAFAQRSLFRNTWYKCREFRANIFLCRKVVMQWSFFTQRLLDTHIFVLLNCDKWKTHVDFVSTRMLWQTARKQYEHLTFASELGHHFARQNAGTKWHPPVSWRFGWLQNSPETGKAPTSKDSKVNT